MARILLAEDEFLIRMIMAEELADAGHDVTEAETGDQALAVALRNGAAYEILVTDIHMPGELDGVTLAERLRALKPDMSVLYVTGRPEALTSMGSLGPNESFVRKPFDGPEIISAVTRLLDASGDHDGFATPAASPPST